YYGDDFTVEYPTGSGRLMTLFEVAQELATRLTRIFLRDGRGQRPAFGGSQKFQNDPHWRDLILFHEYFQGDNGTGARRTAARVACGRASHTIRFQIDDTTSARCRIRIDRARRDRRFCALHRPTPRESQSASHGGGCHERRPLKGQWTQLKGKAREKW